MTDQLIELAAGGVLWRLKDGKTEVLLAHRPAYDDWTFPKGRLEEGESLIQCAVREAEEETSLPAVLGRFLGMTSYIKRSGRHKEVSYWAMRVGEGEFRPGREVDQVRWVRPGKLVKHLTHGVDREFAAGLPEDWTAPPDRILLTRHAHAGVRGTWDGDDSLRPLSKKGDRQARGLASQLAAFEIDRILTSPAVRCQQTVDPLALSRGLDRIVTRSLWEMAGPEETRALLDAHRRGTTLLCSHGPNLINALREMLGDWAGLPVQKGSTWVFDLEEGRTAASNYLAPPGP